MPLVKDNPLISVIYLTYNGLSLVKTTLVPLCETLKKETLAIELVIVDDASEDQTDQYVEQLSYPLKFVSCTKNMGFAKAANLGAKNSKAPFLFFINNDMLTEKNFLTRLIETYKRFPQAFAVTPRFLRWDKKTPDDGIRFPFFKSGFLDTFMENVNSEEKEKETVFFLGGGFLVSKEKFLLLGGFDEIYTPFSWEDLDLGYRAVKRGMVNLCCPHVTFYHKRSATTKAVFSEATFKSFVWKNKFIFHWANITDKRLLTEHFILLPWKLLKFTLNGRWPYVLGFFKALFHLKKIIKKRNNEKFHFVLNDRDILRPSTI